LPGRRLGRWHEERSIMAVLVALLLPPQDFQKINIPRCS
jgi:hypothetical protein